MIGKNKIVSPEGKEYIHQYKYEVKIRIHGHLDKP